MLSDGVCVLWNFYMCVYVPFSFFVSSLLSEIGVSAFRNAKVLKIGVSDSRSSEVPIFGLSECRSADVRRFGIPKRQISTFRTSDCGRQKNLYI